MRYLFLLLAIMSFVMPGYSQQTLSGKVVSDSLLPLPDVEVTIPDLRLRQITGTDGKFTFRNLSCDHALLQFRRLGYKTLLLDVRFSGDTLLLITLEESVIEGHEVVITGNLTGSDHEENSAPVHSMNKNEWRENAPSNIIDVISKTPGVSQVSTGPQVSKPVIRGLGFNRILVLHDGVRQEGQQWGDEHGVELDAFGAERIEVMRGPASLIYGSDAMGGVINVLEPFPSPWNSIEGEVFSEMQSNNRQYGLSAFLQGNRNGVLWKFRTSYKNAGNYRTPEEIVYNSMFREMSVMAGFGWQKKWGYSQHALSVWKSTIGLMEGERDSLGAFTDEEGNTVTEDFLKGRRLALPFQQVEHRKWTSRTHLLREKYHVDIIAGWQENIRKEYEGSIDTAAMQFNLFSTTLDIQFHRPRTGGWEFIWGLNGMYQANRIRGEELLIPEFRISDAGLFLFSKRTLKKSTFSMGLRYSYRGMEIFSTAVDAYGRPLEGGPFQAFNDTVHHFYGPSFSTGLTLRLSPVLSIKNSISSGFRAPNPFELYAAGVHEGTQRFEYGNPGMKQEMSFQYDLGLILEKKKFHLEPSFFVNIISDYTYLLRAGDAMFIEDGDTLEIFIHAQSDALLYGGEMMADWHPIEKLHIRNVFSWVEGTSLPGSTPLPMIPAPRVITDIKFEPSVGRNGSRWKAAWLKLTADLNMEQYRVAYFETPSSMYLLLGLGGGISYKVKNTEIKFRAGVHNLLNTNYAAHLSRLRYIGIQNAGRNFTFGIEIPFKHIRTEDSNR
ncbi:MAG: TonB-dependent receptor [Bacteroidia bacterium]|nr:TonB-dependent receptor [Bacteroidia bacterium]